MDANIKTIDSDWIRKWEAQFTDNVNIVRLISPFINSYMVDRLIKIKGERKIQVITRYNLNDFFAKASDIKALEKLVKNGIEIKGIQNLHSKVYIFDNESVIIASANFTSGGFIYNKEFGVLSDSQPIVLNSINYFQSLWECTNTLLTQARIEEFKKELGAMAKTPAVDKSKDYGASPVKKILGDRRCFVKFFGYGNERDSLLNRVKQEVEISDCYFALTFPAGSGRPRRYRDGDVVFIARMVEGQDYAIFGRAIAREHKDDRDVASSEDISAAHWKADFPIYIRVHSGEFLDTTFEHCPKLQSLMSDLQGESFRASKERMQRDGVDVNPRMSLRQKPDIQLSEEGAIWLEQEFKDAKDTHGLLSDSYIDSLYQGIPEIK